MAEDISKPKPRSFQRHLREEQVVINGATVIFYRDRKRRRWSWRALDAQVTLPPSFNSNRAKTPNNGSER
ncbi:hypothetical protein NA78x_004068 [Anatilimnocola sp. NA78]|uniref:hypothetical protein n=1 Tax=Anatilimnocola sp. NA78 TaxID=3415683 RepID=UPI003CE4FBEC